MKKSIWFLSLPVCVVVLWTLLASCDTSTGPEKDKWSDVTSLEQLNGKWKGSYKYTMPVKEIMEIIETEDSLIQSIPDDMKVTVSAKITTIINANERTQSGSIEDMTMTFSGKNIDILWAVLKLALVDIPVDIPDVSFDDKKHSITFPDQPIEEQEITDEEVQEMLSSGLQINQKGNKIKMPGAIIQESLQEVLPVSMLDFPDFTMTKQ